MRLLPGRESEIALFFLGGNLKERKKKYNNPERTLVDPTFAKAWQKLQCQKCQGSTLKKGNAFSLENVLYKLICEA